MSSSQAERDSSAIRPRSFPLQSLVTLLCMVTGSLDALTFKALGEAFASIITGNVVFLGIAAGTGNGRLAEVCGLAVGGYILGVVLGGWLVHQWKRGNDDAIWPARVTNTLTVQLALLSTCWVIWIILHGEPGGVWERVLLVMVAGLMGMQSAAIRAIKVSVSTTYMTGALTTLIEAVVTRRAFTSTEKSAIGGLLALVMGALLTSLVIYAYKPAAMVVPTVSLGVVVLVAVLWSRGSATGKQTHLPR